MDDRIQGAALTYVPESVFATGSCAEVALRAYALLGGYAIHAPHGDDVGDGALLANGCAARSAPAELRLLEAERARELVILDQLLLQKDDEHQRVVLRALGKLDGVGSIRRIGGAAGGLLVAAAVYDAQLGVARTVSGEHHDAQGVLRKRAIGLLKQKVAVVTLEMRLTVLADFDRGNAAADIIGKTTEGPGKLYRLRTKIIQNEFGYVARVESAGHNLRRTHTSLFFA